MRLHLSMTAYRRPDFLRQVLAGLSACRGVGEWTLGPNVDPHENPAIRDEVVSVFDGWNACQLDLVLNPRRLGLNKNTHASMLRARGAEMVVHLEDDTVPTPDALEYFLWCKEKIARGDGQPCMATAYNRTRLGTERPGAVKSRRILTPWLWGTTGQRLGWFLINWCFKNPHCFTCTFKSRYSSFARELFPEVSRVQNIGSRDGDNPRGGSDPERWHRKHRHVPRPSDGTLVEYFLTR